MRKAGTRNRNRPFTIPEQMHLALYKKTVPDFEYQNSLLLFHIDMRRTWRSRAWKKAHPLSFPQKIKYRLRRLILPIRIFLGKLGLPEEETFFHMAAKWVKRHSIEGDYCEFGVYTGRSFVQAYQAIHQDVPGLKYFAFDSFEGLPAPGKEDLVYPQFSEGSFAATQPEFVGNLKKHNLNMASVEIVPGWFSDVLTPSLAKEIGLSRVAVAFIDSDLYISTGPVLDFLTDLLADGSLIVFDDWHAFRGHPDLGPQKAFREWKTKNPYLRFSPFPSAPNSYQRAFIVHKPLNDQSR